MIDEGLRSELQKQGVFTTTLEEVYNWGRANSVWPLTFGLACCAIEMIAASMSRFDMARFGAEVFRPSPRQADLMIVAGTVTKKMAPLVVRLYNQMPEPKYVIAMGACAISGGPFKQGYNVLKGIDRYIPVDVVIPGGIGDHTVFRARQEAEQCAVAAGLNGGARGRPVPQRITFRRLDFDHVGAAIGQQLGAVRARYSGGQINDRVAGQRRFGPGLRH